MQTLLTFFFLGFTASFGVIGGTIFTNKMTLSREVTPHITERGQSAQVRFEFKKKEKKIIGDYANAASTTCIIAA